MQYKTPLERYRKKKERRIAKAYGRKSSDESRGSGSRFSHSPSRKLKD